MTRPRASVAPLAALVAVVAVGCGGDGAPDAGATAPLTIEVSSPAFDDGEPIPVRHTCDGDDVRPPLRWSDVPDEAVSLALVVHDPDAPGGSFVHWVVAGLPTVGGGLAEGAPLQGVEGTNGFDEPRYRGPCPPPDDEAHRYVFTVYAVDARLSLDPGFSSADLDAALAGHVLARGQLTGTYDR